VPQIDTLLNAGLLAPHNPNSVQPFRLSRAQNDTCDQDHGYTDEQAAMNGGKVDRFVETVGVGGPGCADYGVGRGLVMGYYDGSTVTALWNYARHFAMSDHFQHHVRPLVAGRAEPDRRPDRRGNSGRSLDAVRRRPLHGVLVLDERLRRRLRL